VKQLLSKDRLEVWEPQAGRTQLGPPDSERPDYRHLEEASRLVQPEANGLNCRCRHVGRYLEVASQPVQLPEVNCFGCRRRHRRVYYHQPMVEVNLGGLKEWQPEQQPEQGVPVGFELQAPHLFSLS